MKTEGMTEEQINQRHAEKMAKKKAARDKMLAGKTDEKGLLMVHTGKGKGKSTAAMGLAARAVGNDKKVGILQFVKGAWDILRRDEATAEADKYKVEKRYFAFSLLYLFVHFGAILAEAALRPWGMGGW